MSIPVGFQGACGALVAVLALTGCGATRTYVGGTFSDGNVSFRLDAPGGGWDAVDVSHANDLAWYSADLDAILQANGSCNPRLDIPLSALTNHLLIGFTDREVVSEETLPLADREALRTHVRARLDGVQREMTFVVVKKDECVYDFAVVAPPARFADARRAFDTLLSSFETR